MMMGGKNNTPSGIPSMHRSNFNAMRGQITTKKAFGISGINQMTLDG